MVAIGGRVVIAPEHHQGRAGPRNGAGGTGVENDWAAIAEAVKKKVKFAP